MQKFPSPLTLQSLKKLRENFDTKPHAYTPNRLLDTITIDSEFAQCQADVGRSVIKHMRDNNAYERGDYKECLDLIEAYLGDNEKYSFLRPGAVHKARWMGKQLY